MTPQGLEVKASGKMHICASLYPMNMDIILSKYYLAPPETILGVTRYLVAY